MRSEASKLILCGDIGGTKALLALAENDSSKIVFGFRRELACADYTDFSPLFGDFLHAAHSAGFHPAMIARGCLAVAGPVDADGLRARLTNLPWTVDAAALAAKTGCGPLSLVNDFAAAAAGIEALAADDLLTLQAGAPLAHAPRVVVGAGTGLGVAALVWQEATQDYLILPGEGGHVGYAPGDAEQATLWAWLHARLPQGRVSAERVVSGPGLLCIYDFLCDRNGADQPDPRHSADPTAALNELALARPDSRARHAYELFYASYGAVAGDLALTLLARGGVYIAGGIAARTLPLLQASRFREAFNAKAEHADLAAQMPVHVVTDTDLGLKGAALLAARQAARSPRR